MEIGNTENIKMQKHYSARAGVIEDNNDVGRSEKQAIEIFCWKTFATNQLTQLFVLIHLFEYIPRRCKMRRPGSKHPESTVVIHRQKGYFMNSNRVLSPLQYGLYISKDYLFFPIPLYSIRIRRIPVYSRRLVSPGSGAGHIGVLRIRCIVRIWHRHRFDITTAVRVRSVEVVFMLLGLSLEARQTLQYWRVVTFASDWKIRRTTVLHWIGLMFVEWERILEKRIWDYPSG